MHARLSALFFLVLLPQAVMAQEVEFGTDGGEWARDGECDDRRFFGPGMAQALSWDSVGLDATDCRAAWEAGQVRRWNLEAARAATSCAALDFGDDGGDYPRDGECDDPRFEGPGVARLLLPSAAGRDATDCARLCAFGVLALRDY